MTSESLDQAIMEIGPAKDFYQGPWRKRALEAFLKEWSPGLVSRCTRSDARKVLTRVTSKRLKSDLQGEGCGSMVIAFLLLTVAGAAISWLVQRILDRLYPNKTSYYDAAFAAKLSVWKGST